MSDQLIRFITKDHQFRVLAAETSALCEKLRSMHGTDPTATVALSRVTTGAALLGGLLKGGQRLALAIEGNGPLKKLHAETDARGNIRSSVKNPHANLPPREDRYDVANAVGQAGFLSVIKDLGLKEPYRGSVQLQTSEIGDDIAYYLTTSEQVPSAVTLGVSLGSMAEVKTAGGILIQALPGCSDEAIDQIIHRLSEIPSLSATLQNGGSIEMLLDDLFDGIERSPAEKIALNFRCNCTREQVAEILKSIGRKELEELVSKEEEIEVTCEYCRQGYRFTPSDVAGMIG